MEKGGKVLSERRKGEEGEVTSPLKKLGSTVMVGKAKKLHFDTGDSSRK